ncbi:hypothetical protein F2Q68_00046036 [Brassica cretica]|uniref:Uncharacterized protein n=1 Tax=Brassica cretica TaxID=69181 RepID=A0A8S9LPG4_BRACR|nr:hypothetical protein F2Q68_00046036 [Brassica cretica]
MGKSEQHPKKKGRSQSQKPTAFTKEEGDDARVDSQPNDAKGATDAGKDSQTTGKRKPEKNRRYKRELNSLSERYRGEKREIAGSRKP